MCIIKLICSAFHHRARLTEIKVNLRTIFLAKQLYDYEDKGNKIFLKDIDLDSYSDGNERTLAYYSAKHLHLLPEVGIPLLWDALHQQYDF